MSMAGLLYNDTRPGCTVVVGVIFIKTIDLQYISVYMYLLNLFY